MSLPAPHLPEPSSQRALSQQLMGSNWVQPSELTPGSAFGRYQILRGLGQGATSEVLLAEDPGIGRLVAIKALTPRPGLTTERFQREVRVLADMRHPNIVQIFDVGVAADGRPYYVMECGEGGSLHDAELELDAFVDVLERVADACAYAHARKVVHRDLKPPNILVGERTLVVDFGVAKLLDDGGNVTRTGALVGTPQYMAPEQAGEGRVGPWTDVFALGAMLYERLTGRRPFEGRTLQALVSEVERCEVLPPSELVAEVPAPLERLCLRALAKQPDERPTAEEFASALRAWRQAGDGPSARVIGALVGVAVALALVVVVAWPSSSSSSGDAPASPAELALASPEVTSSAPAPAEPAPTPSPAPSASAPALAPATAASLADAWAAWTELHLLRYLGHPPAPRMREQALALSRGCEGAVGPVLVALVEQDFDRARQLAESLQEEGETGQALRHVTLGQLELGAGDLQAAGTHFAAAVGDAQAAQAARVGALLVASEQMQARPSPYSVEDVLEAGVALLELGGSRVAWEAFAAGWRAYGLVTGVIVRTRGAPPSQQRLLERAQALLADQRPEGGDRLARQVAACCADLILWRRTGASGTPAGQGQLLEILAAEPDSIGAQLSLVLSYLIEGEPGAPPVREALARADELAPGSREIDAYRRAWGGAE